MTDLQHRRDIVRSPVASNISACLDLPRLYLTAMAATTTDFLLNEPPKAVDVRPAPNKYMGLPRLRVVRSQLHRASMQLTYA